MDHRLAPYPYQGDVIARLVASTALGSGVYAALEQGLGKTMIALKAAHAARAERVLVVAPTIGCLVWQAEAVKWLPVGSYRVILPKTTLGVPNLCDTRPKDGMIIVVVSYDQLSRRPGEWLAALRAFDPDTVILDEAHRLKTRTAIRTHVVYGPKCDGKGGLIEHAARVWALSGTPCPNATAELWTWLHAAAPELITVPMPGRGMVVALSEYDFQDRFSRVAYTPYGRKITGSKNTELLRRLIAPGFVRLVKRDVLKDLPPIRFVATPLDLELSEDPFADLSELSVSDAELLDQLARLPIASARRELGLLKVTAIVSWVTTWFDDAPSDAKLILFALHRDVLKRLRQDLGEYRPVLVDGSTPRARRAAFADDFQTDPDCRLFLGQIQAAGEVITLTAASTVVIAEAEFVPSRIAQAAARAHRIGQADSVLVHLLGVPGTLDARIARVAARKAEEIAALFDTQGTDQDADHQTA